jgi:hypothetical protein
MFNLKGLRRFGPVGIALANVLTFLTANWGIVVSVLAGLYVGRSDWASGYVQNPQVDAGAFAFLVLLWTYIGFTTLIDRRKSRLVSVRQDFDYGLLFEGCVPFYAPTDTGAALQLGVRLHNYTGGPLGFNVEKFEINIGGRPFAQHLGTDSGFMPRGGTRIYKTSSFPQSDLKDYQNRKVIGSIELLMTYGYPYKKPVRRLETTLEIHLDFTQPGSLGYAESTLKESDEAIDS